MRIFLNTKLLLIGSLNFLLLSACNNRNNATKTAINSTSGIVQINYSVIQEFPHDTSLFTEGLLFYNGQLFESTGSPDELSFTKSLIGIDNLSTGSFIKKVELEKKYFGEGIVFFKKKLYQLTYKNQQGFIYDAQSFKQIKTFHYSNVEGWSLTTDGINLIMSDGTNKLTFLNPESLSPIKTLSVTDNNDIQQDSLNELEFIKGFIYANVWQTNEIIKIDTSNGKVVGKLNLNSLTFDAKNKKPDIDVLNGIAYDSLTDKIYVTGKLWTNIYEINFTH